MKTERDENQGHFVCGSRQSERSLKAGGAERCGLAGGLICAQGRFFQGQLVVSEIRSNTALSLSIGASRPHVATLASQNWRSGPFQRCLAGPLGFSRTPQFLLQVVREFRCANAAISGRKGHEAQREWFQSFSVHVHSWCQTFLPAERKSALLMADRKRVWFDF